MIDIRPPLIHCHWLIKKRSEVDDGKFHGAGNDGKDNGDDDNNVEYEDEDDDDDDDDDDKPRCTPRGMKTDFLIAMLTPTHSLWFEEVSNVISRHLKCLPRNHYGLKRSQMWFQKISNYYHSLTMV